MDPEEIEAQQCSITEARVKQMVKVIMTQKDWEERLLDSCMNGEDQMLLIHLVCLLKMDILQSNPIQLMVIRNLVSTLLKLINNSLSLNKGNHDRDGVWKSDLN